MSKILSTSEAETRQVEAFTYDNYLGLQYEDGPEVILLNRAERQDLYSYIQEMMADELRAAGFVETKRLNGERWFSLPPFNKATPLDEAWQEMMEGTQNDSRN
jgi:hypothetical protein